MVRSVVTENVKSLERLRTDHMVGKTARLGLARIMKKRVSKVSSRF
jgi:hypothetical protein